MSVLGRSISGFLRFFLSFSSTRCLIFAEFILWILFLYLLFYLSEILEVRRACCISYLEFVARLQRYRGERIASHCDRQHAAARPAQRPYLLIAKRRRVSSERQIELLNTLFRKSASLRFSSRNLYMRRHHPTFDAKMMDVSF